MLAYFPSLYPGELLYSWFARYHEHSGNTSPKQTMKELFGSASVSAVVDLPAYLSDFHQNIKQFNPPNVKELIKHHTLYKYYTLFQPNDVKSKAKHYMKYGGKPGAIHMFLGIVASTIKDCQYIRFCPNCVKQDRVNYGESYWHVSHQLPKVHYCQIHQEPLQDSNVELRNPYKHQFVSAEKAELKKPYLKRLFSKKTEQHLQKLSKESLNLIIDTSSFDLKELQNIYKYLMQVNGYANYSGKVHQEHFTKQFKLHYGEEFLSLVDCNFDENSGTSWPRSIVRKHRKAFHSVQHLLLLNFLGTSINELSKLKGKKYHPFGDAPYFCLNPAANHYKERVVRDVSITTCSDTGKPVGTFTCDCGFVYSRRGPDVNERDVFRVGRIKSFGDVWEAKLQSLLLKGLSYYAVAQILECDYTTVKKYAEGKINNKKTNNDPVQSLKGIKEPEWTILIKEHPNLTVTQLRKIAPALYTWHYRNNRQWLKENSPKTQSKTHNNNRVNWQKRDLEVLAHVKKSIQELYAIEKPVYVCRSRIGKEISRTSLIEKFIDKLPKTKKYLDHHIETREEYQIRRINWAINEIIKKDQSLQEWKVCRLAGLKNELSPRVKQSLKIEIEKHTFIRLFKSRGGI